MQLQFFIDPSSPTSQDVLDELKRQFTALDRSKVEMKSLKAKAPAGTLATADVDIASIIITFGPLAITALKAIFDIVKDVRKSKGGQKEPPKIVVVVVNKAHNKIVLPANKEEEQRFLDSLAADEEDKK